MKPGTSSFDAGRPSGFVGETWETFPCANGLLVESVGAAPSCSCGTRRRDLEHNPPPKFCLPVAQPSDADCRLLQEFRDLDYEDWEIEEAWPPGIE